MNNFNTLLANINRNNIYPPPEIEEVLNFFNSKKPMRDHERCHAYRILGYSVAKECRRIGEFDPILIRKVADHLWNTSTSQEKAEYVNLAQRVVLLYDKNYTVSIKNEIYLGNRFPLPSKF
ncbi:hypothetical protein Glove_43g78 [Diversispora epigaea]|uniref:HMG box domain-containing protein n=1 Tax=Diversispora epigaea TaxID=1348612 RepID=A0A397JEU3_9GLOM|nr:hypothetical protein Glove_43g78 [Diversispora epigaea]